MIDPDAIALAAERTAGHLRYTPVFVSDGESLGLKGIGTVELKLEFLQHTGSFKPRGAFNLVLAQRTPPAQLAAASGGNHGQAVAYVAGRLGLPATIFVPEICSPVKQARIAGYGAEVRVAGAIYDDAQAACTAWAQDRDALVVHPYDDDLILAGQGTTGLELQNQCPHLDTVLVAAGGGGLVAGIAAWYGPAGNVRVVSVEPETSQCVAAALRAREPVTVAVSGIAADSLGAGRIGAAPFTVLARYLADALTVPDEAIVDAQRTLWESARLAVEPGGATAFAALFCGAYRPSPGERVGVILCGANFDPSTIARDSIDII